MTSRSFEGRGDPTSEHVCAALRAMGTKIPEGNPDGLSRAELLGHLLAVTEATLIVEDDPLALESVHRGYFGYLAGYVQAAGFPYGSWNTPLQEMWVRLLDLRVRRAAYDFANLRQLLPAAVGQHYVGSTVDSLLSAVIELLQPYYPRPAEHPVQQYGRFRDSLKPAGARVASARRSLDAFRKILKERGIKV